MRVFILCENRGNFLFIENLIQTFPEIWLRSTKNFISSNKFGKAIKTFGTNAFRFDNTVPALLEWFYFRYLNL